MMFGKLFVEIDGKKIEFKNWKVTSFFQPDGECVNVISDEPVVKSNPCDCGAEKSKTTHATWCSAKC